jgi:hypothetical protein
MLMIMERAESLPGMNGMSVTLCGHWFSHADVAKRCAEGAPTGSVLGQYLAIKSHWSHTNMALII